MKMFPHLLSLVVFLYLSCDLTQRVAAQHKISCIERERQALLHFKHGLVDEYGHLSSWGNDVHQAECCNWRGVHCSNITGHVTVLDLNGYSLIGHKVSPSLLELKYLDYLDLGGNDFQWSPIPEFIGSFPRLRVLSLRANFSGAIPPQLGNLTTLQILNINGYPLIVKDLNWLSRLSSLKCIDLSGVQFQIHSPQITVNLPPSLEVLDLDNCGLSGALPFSLNSSSFSPSLSVVDFSYNALNSSSVVHFLRNAGSQLTSIDISQNSFGGLIPDIFGGMKFLESLNLAGNSFTGGIPKSFGNLTNLQSLYLYSNELNEPIAELLGKLSGAWKSLQTLQLNGNYLTGALPASFGQECGFVYLDLSQNKITGQFPDISHCSSLRFLCFYDNQLQGGLPETIGKLSKLQELHVSSNSLEGVITEAHFSNLTNLRVLDLSYNVALSFSLNSSWVPPFQLSVLYLAKCKMGTELSEFPKWLQTQTKLSNLDISSGGISDTIPDWFWNFSTSLQYLNLSYNKIGGSVPDLSTKFSSFLVIDLSSNNFWGPVPLFPQKIPLLHLSNNKFDGSISFLCSSSPYLYSIDVSNNQLSGEIPDCWNNFFNLELLNLANNHFFGNVPNSLGSLVGLQLLHLRNNNLTGELPSFLQNCTSLRVMDFGGNKLTGRIPSWIGRSLTKLIILSLRHNNFLANIPPFLCHLNDIQILDLSVNKLNGEIPNCFNNFTHLMQKIRNATRDLRWEYPLTFKALDFSYMDNILIQWKNKEWEFLKQLGLLKSIDLSSNQLTGDIPEEFSVLKGLISLNLSRNHLTGKIFETIYQMENLESLDLSRNQLSGEIPIGLARLTFLGVLDLSNNFLSGKIPTSTQLQSFDASCYAGNRGLCGDPLPECPENDSPQNKNNDYQEDDDFLDWGFYISMVLGFFLSFWGIIITLVLKESWRSAYYRFLNDVKDWLYVAMKIYLVRLQRKFKCTI